jgi:hypothetical protein
MARSTSSLMREAREIFSRVAAGEGEIDLHRGRLGKKTRPAPRTTPGGWGISRAEWTDWLFVLFWQARHREDRCQGTFFATVWES